MSSSKGCYANAAAADQGVTGVRTVKTLIDKIGATKKATIALTHSSTSDETVYTLSTSLTIPANIELQIHHGVIISIPNGVTLTINGPFEAGLHQVFSCVGTGTVLFGMTAVREDYPQWFAKNATPGTTDMSSAISAAINATPAPTVIAGGAFLVTSQITIGSANKKIAFGPDGSIVRAAAVAADAVFASTDLDGLIFENIRMTVAADTTDTMQGMFINLYGGNHIRFIMPSLDGANGAGSPTLLRAISTPDCNDVTVEYPNIRNIYGNGCGPWNNAGTPGHGEGYFIIAGKIWNVMDTGIGAWTGAKKLRVLGTTIGRDDYVNYSSYPGAGIDVAGAEDVDIQAILDGNCIGIRVLTNLGYNNKSIRVHNSTFKNQRQIGSEPGQGMKISMYGDLTENMDVAAWQNHFAVDGAGTGVFGIGISDTHTGAGQLHLKIDDNDFDVVGAGADNRVGIAIISTTTGDIYQYPGSNRFALSGTATAVLNASPSTTYRHVVENGPALFDTGSFSVTTTPQKTGSVYLDRGMYYLTVSFRAMNDNSGVGGLYITDKDTGLINPFGEPIVQSMANTYISRYNFTIDTPGVYDFTWSYSIAPTYEVDFIHIHKVF
jgi:hypothetical protein